MTWSSAEAGLLARAVERAPSVHNLRPWAVEAVADRAELYERAEAQLPRHDPTGRDRIISCGAALANLELAVCALGRRPETVLFPESARSGLLASVTAPRRYEATDDELSLYSAIFRRHSYRAPFSSHVLTAADLRELLGGGDGAEARVVTEQDSLAELLCYAGRVLRDDRAYQRELRAWSTQFPEPLPENSTLPWTGLVTAHTHLPDARTLADRLAREGLFVVVTPDDTRRDHLAAGAVMQRTWLRAVARGLVGSVLTQPLHLHEVRAGFIERLNLPGFPQLLLRLGYPVTATPAAALAAVTARETP
ncbi:hypothetical protein FPZ12_025150 [Amycolatopsis acidicola]|uniref:Uncharacterized protein n=2 Tax=Amycolatopsis acidicola TaxID=2596893 RepID=A0A5N0UWJ3_9PSEU|nr:hypothetical protein FPZ12_025150 [Amycolatopsis acidicola]